MTILANPNGAHRTVSDFTTGRDDNDLPLVLGPQEVHSYKAGGTITEGAALMLVAPTTTEGPTVVEMTAAVTGGDSWRFIGAALEAASSGDQVRICTNGICIVDFDTADTPAAYDLLEAPGTTTGVFGTATAVADNGVYVGYVLGAEIGTTDKVLAYIGRPTVRFEAGA
jgi:hypothetical protein